MDAPQDTTFNQNLSYTILSWPEEHVQDFLELWRLQVFFFATIVFNVLLSALLFFTDNPDRCVRVVIVVVVFVVTNSGAV